MVAKSPAAILRKLRDWAWCPQLTRLVLEVGNEDDAIAARGILQAFSSKRGLEIVVDEVSVAQHWTLDSWYFGWFRFGRERKEKEPGGRRRDQEEGMVV